MITPKIFSKTIKFRFFITVSVAILGFITMLFLLENKLIYIGTPHSDGERPFILENISKLGFSQHFETLNEMNIEYFKKEIGSDNNVLFLGGNSEDVLFKLLFLNRVFENHNIYTLNYPSYGGSNGIPNEENIKKIISQFIQKNQLDNKKLILIGRSLGTGFATITTSQFPNVEKLILVSPYYSLEEVAMTHFPFIPIALIDVFMENKIETHKFAEKVNIPTLIFYVKEDNVVHAKHTEKLIPYFKKSLVEVIKNEDHRSILTSEQTINKIKEYLKQN